MKRKPTREKQEQAKHQLAKQLGRLTKGMVDVTYEPTMYIDGQPEAKGHVFYAHFSPPPGSTDDTMYLDDRHGDLAHQLALELNRVGLMYMSLALKVANGIGKPAAA